MQMVHVTARETTLLEEPVTNVKWNIIAIPIVLIVIVKYKTQLVEQMNVIKQVGIVDVRKTTWEEPATNVPMVILEENVNSVQMVIMVFPIVEVS